MLTQFDRSEMVLGKEALEILASKRVAVFGLGGVGSHAVEALARAGIGSLLLVDCDTLCLTNINRQLYALHSTLGRLKTEAARDRVLDINPLAKVETSSLRFGPDTAGSYDFSPLDFVIDCVDDVTAKLLLAEKCRDAGMPLLSSMGTGNKIDPSRFEFADVSETSVCPLARVMRREVKKRGLGPLRVLYSREPPRRARDTEGSGAEESAGDGSPSRAPGSLPWVPPVAGFMLAGEAVRIMLGLK